MDEKWVLNQFRPFLIMTVWRVIKFWISHLEALIQRCSCPDSFTESQVSPILENFTGAVEISKTHRNNQKSKISQSKYNEISPKIC